MRQTQLTDEDRKNVTKLRELVAGNLTDFYDTDFNLLRWLKGHHPLPIEKIAEKLNYHLKARSSTWQLDRLGTAPRNHPVHKHWKYGITGPSKVLDNVVVNIEQCGETDYWGLVHKYPLTDVLRARIQDLEDMLYHVMTLEEQTGKQAHILYVMDLTDLKYNTQLYHLIMGPLKSLAEFMSEHYVELIKYFVLVNVPKFVYALWYTVQPLLPEKTKEKVRILSSSNWRKEILNYAVPESLPDKWNISDEQVFTSSVSVPIRLDESEYSHKNYKIPSNAEKVNVCAGKTLFMTRELNAGDSLSWWMMANGDFSFGVFRTSDKTEEDINKMDIVYPCLGYMPGPLIVPLEDAIKAEKQGYYKVYFANSRAWWHTLVVTCTFTITPQICDSPNTVT